MLSRTASFIRLVVPGHEEIRTLKRRSKYPAPDSPYRSLLKKAITQGMVIIERWVVRFSNSFAEFDALFSQPVSRDHQLYSHQSYRTPRTLQHSQFLAVLFASLPRSLARIDCSFANLSAHQSCLHRG